MLVYYKIINYFIINTLSITNIIYYNINRIYVYYINSAMIFYKLEKKN